MSPSKGGQPGTVRYRAEAVVPCDGSRRVFRPGFVDVAGGAVTRVGALHELVDTEAEERLEEVEVRACDRLCGCEPASIRASHFRFGTRRL